MAYVMDANGNQNRPSERDSHGPAEHESTEVAAWAGGGGGYAKQVSSS